MTEPIARSPHFGHYLALTRALEREKDMFPDWKKFEMDGGFLQIINIVHPTTIYSSLKTK